MPASATLQLLVRPRLGELLRERSLTQTELAEMAGIPLAAIRRFDRSIQHKDAHLIAISRALGVTVEDLFEVAARKEPSNR